MNNLAGTLLRIVYYPIKGFHGKEVTQVNLTKNKGLLHDRRWAIRNGSIPQNSAHGWEPCQAFVRMTQHESLPLYAVETSDLSLYLSHPSGEKISINKFENHKGKLSEWFSHNDISLSHANDNTAYWDHHDAHISIINITTVKAIANTAGITLDPQRFRGNLLIETTEPWSEFALLGHKISIGGVELEILRPIDRCKATSVNPATGESDLNIPHLLSSQYGHIFCGIYARVVKSGKINKNDKLCITAPAQKAIKNGIKASTTPTPEQWPRPMRLVKRISESHNVESFWLEDPLSTVINNIAPASYLRLHVENENNPVTRSYTISKYSDNGRLLRISVKKETGDAKFSPWIHSTLQVGDTILASGPFVDPSLIWRPDTKPYKDVLIITAGIGITVATSILLALKKANYSSTIRIAHSIRYEKDAALWEEVINETHALKNIKTTLFVTQENELNVDSSTTTFNHKKQGRINMSEITKNISLNNIQVFLCGPQQFNQSIHKVLIQKGVNSNAIHEDVFYSPQSFSEPTYKQPSLTTATPITFKHASGKISTFSWAPKHGTLLDAAEANGIAVSANCRSGACRACLYPIKGEVENLTSPVSPAPKHWAYLCCVAPLSALTITESRP